MIQDKCKFSHNDIAFAWKTLYLLGSKGHLIDVVQVLAQIIPMWHKSRSLLIFHNYWYKGFFYLICPTIGVESRRLEKFISYDGGEILYERNKKIYFCVVTQNPSMIGMKLPRCACLQYLTGHLLKQLFL